jgi:hypothetical protein
LVIAYPHICYLLGGASGANHVCTQELGGIL